MRRKSIHQMIEERRSMTPRERKLVDDAYKRGVIAASEEAAQYDGTSFHEYRLGDCIAGKLNATARKKPRRNRSAMPRPGFMLMRGIAMTLAQIVEYGPMDLSDLSGLAETLGVKMKTLVESGVPRETRRILRKVGVR